MDTAGLKTIRAMKAEESLSKQCVIKGNNAQVPYCKLQANGMSPTALNRATRFRPDVGAQEVAESGPGHGW